MQIKDNYMIGRGVADDKGPMVATRYALKFLKEEGVSLRYPCLLYTSLFQQLILAEGIFVKNQIIRPDAQCTGKVHNCLLYTSRCV